MEAIEILISEQWVKKRLPKVVIGILTIGSIEIAFTGIHFYNQGESLYFIVGLILISLLFFFSLIYFCYIKFKKFNVLILESGVVIVTIGLHSKYVEPRELSVISLRSSNTDNHYYLTGKNDKCVKIPIEAFPQLHSIITKSFKNIKIAT